MRRVFVGLAQVFVGLAAQLLCVVRIQGVGTGLSRSQRGLRGALRLRGAGDRLKPVPAPLRNPGRAQIQGRVLELR